MQPKPKKLSLQQLPYPNTVGNRNTSSNMQSQSQQRTGQSNNQNKQSPQPQLPLGNITNFASLMAPKHFKATNLSTAGNNDQEQISRNSPVTDLSLDDSIRKQSNTSSASNNANHLSKRKLSASAGQGDTSSQNNNSTDMDIMDDNHLSAHMSHLETLQKRSRYMLQQQQLNSSLTDSHPDDDVAEFSDQNGLNPQDYEVWEEDDYLDEEEDGRLVDPSQEADEENEVELVDDNHDGHDDRKGTQQLAAGQYIQESYDEKGNLVWYETMQVSL
jgi:hypothetical protein